ncbi:uncharacterized protein LOC107791773 [Nicotiana tabacum]|uniref:Uncharacterized protein LOC107791773 n=1 Tax=Nicotiana tabacum TaxID=4097 RepID=A0AC58RV16_TOBAC
MGGDSKHFLLAMGLHQGSALSPILFALVMDALTHHIQGEVAWYILFVDDIVLIDEMRGGVNETLEVWRHALKSKGFKLRKTKTEYLKCKFSAYWRELGMNVRLGSQVIPKRVKIDVSDIGYGSISKQEKEIKEHIVAFASKRWNNSQKDYPTINKNSNYPRAGGGSGVRR